MQYELTVPVHGKNPSPSFPYVAVGDMIVIDPRQAVGFEVIAGSHVVLQSLRAYACSNECFVSTHTVALSILNCALELLPGRILAANNGGHNHHGGRVGQWIEVQQDAQPHMSCVCVCFLNSITYTCDRVDCGKTPVMTSAMSVGWSAAPVPLPLLAARYG